MQTDSTANKQTGTPGDPAGVASTQLEAGRRMYYARRLMSAGAPSTRFADFYLPALLINSPDPTSADAQPFCEPLIQVSIDSATGVGIGDAVVVHQISTTVTGNSLRIEVTAQAVKALIDDKADLGGCRFWCNLTVIGTPVSQ